MTCLSETFSYLQQSVFNLSLLSSPPKIISIRNCTNDFLVSIPESLLKTEVNDEKRFECHEQIFILADFIGFDRIQEVPNIVIPQVNYLWTNEKKTSDIIRGTKLKLQSGLTDVEQTINRTASERLIWITTCTLPPSVCHAIVNLQVKQNSIAALKIFRGSWVVIPDGKPCVFYLHYCRNPTVISLCSRSHLSKIRQALAVWSFVRSREWKRQTQLFRLTQNC